ncbi:hypothetical protein CONLIGDRAFT_650650 [Coniochaeta ligniaria NRRL 30616]|uniref:Uncharacterized protein n=1 Tax=Coniochaeta ligniaria NRRL 30616 TaxID=1408157 RepID=A0A1J7IZM2_9PEZI|nr:hypothetical protein CONLIGDRAFT_650650 [Coniochaeta ligniaria NRRL 30616]
MESVKGITAQFTMDIAKQSETSREGEQPLSVQDKASTPRPPYPQLDDQKLPAAVYNNAIHAAGSKYPSPPPTDGKTTNKTTNNTTADDRYLGWITKIEKELAIPGFFASQNINLGDYVPDFDAPSLTVKLLFEVACRRRGLTLGERKSTGISVYMNGWELHQLRRWEIQDFLVAFGFHERPAYQLAVDIREALDAYQQLHPDEFKDAMDRRRKRKEVKRAHKMSGGRGSNLGLVLVVLVPVYFLLAKVLHWL